MPEGQVLEVEIREYGFRFYLKDKPEKSFFVKVDELNPKYFVFIEETNRIMKSVHDYKSEDFGVNNVVELLCALLLKPNEYFEALVGEKAEIREVRVFFS